MSTKKEVCVVNDSLNKEARSMSSSVASVQAYDALILDAELRQSLVTIRSLGRRGLAVAALDRASDAPAFSSRWCQRSFVCPSDEIGEAYLIYLEQVLD